MEFMIWAGGRLRRVCPESGLVEVGEGYWGRRARLVCNRRGRLIETPLSTLAHVIKGPKLPKKWYHDVKPKPPPPPAPEAPRLALLKAPKDVSVQTVTKYVHSKLVSRLVQTDWETLPEGIRRNDKQGHSCKGDQTNHQVNGCNKVYSRKAVLKRSRSVSTEIIARKRPRIIKERERRHSQTEEGETDSSDTQESTSGESQFKELIINEEDVSILRRYIETHNTDYDLHRFDSDDNYKAMIFYKINPLVRVERCSKIASMVRERDRGVAKHFARRLGLQSVSDRESDTRSDRGIKRKFRAAKNVALLKSKQIYKDGFRRTHSKRSSRTDTDSQTSSVQTDSRKKKRKLTTESESSDSSAFIVNKLRSKIENDTNGSKYSNYMQRRKLRQSTLQESMNNSKQKLPQTKYKAGVENVETQPVREKLDEKGQRDGVTNQKEKGRRVRAVRLNEGKQEICTSKNMELFLKKVMPRKSSVRPGREFSTLEDHAIVAWLSADAGRERAVNGNRVWKQLQGEYYRITQQSRTWHSLRNRYLRYILPSLGTLALPLDQVQRLRANAYQGELKTKKLARSEKDPPYISAPVMSASARRPPYRLPTESPERCITRRSLRSCSAPRQVASAGHASPGVLTRQQTSPAKSTASGATKSSGARAVSPESSPSYRELTRRFALRHRSTPTSSPHEPANEPPAAASKKRHLFTQKRPSSTFNSPRRT